MSTPPPLTPSYVGIILVIASAAVEGLAQVCLKRSSAPADDKHRWLSLGIALFTVEALLYSGALQRLDISTAYPLGALSFVSVTLFSHWILHETIGLRRWLGLALITCGAALIV